jgi:transcription-repair coupling factor (superfamily II helicase)
MINNIENLDRVPGFQAVLKKIIESESKFSVSGLVGSSRTLLAAWLYGSLKRPILFISPDQESSEKALVDFKTYLGDDEVDLYPSWEIQPYEIRAPHAENIGDRLKILYDLQNGEKKIICIPAVALVEPTISGDDLRKLAFEIKKGDSPITWSPGWLKWVSSAAPWSNNWVILPFAAVLSIYSRPPPRNR